MAQRHNQLRFLVDDPPTRGMSHRERKTEELNSSNSPAHGGREVEATNSVVQLRAIKDSSVVGPQCQRLEVSGLETEVPPAARADVAGAAAGARRRPGRGPAAAVGAVLQLRDGVQDAGERGEHGAHAHVESRVRNLCVLLDGRRVDLGHCSFCLGEADIFFEF